MFTHRRPSAVIVSTFGFRSAGSGGGATSRPRAVLRSLGFGRFGIAAHLTWSRFHCGLELRVRDGCDASVGSRANPLV